jgi:hypothetical protein
MPEVTNLVTDRKAPAAVPESCDSGSCWRVAVCLLTVQDVHRSGLSLQVCHKLNCSDGSWNVLASGAVSRLDCVS